MYKVDTNTNSEASTTSFIDVGIHENVELTNVEFKVSPDGGNEYMVFHFQDEQEKTLSHTEWKAKDDDPAKLANKQLNQIKRIKHIVTKFIPEEKYVIEADDFKTFCSETIRLLGTSYKGVKVRIKVIYSFNNYTSLPRYVPFIENMSVPKEKSKLEILSIDKMVKTQADQERPTQANPFESSSTDTATDDLPF